jgi:plasmid stability protein
MQYTIRNIPGEIHFRLRRRARADGKSLNEAALEALQRGLGIPESGGSVPRRDLSFFSIAEEDAEAIEQTHAFWDRI